MSTWPREQFVVDGRNYSLSGLQMRVLRDTFAHESSYTTPKSVDGTGHVNTLRSMPGLVARSSWYGAWKWTLTADGRSVVDALRRWQPSQHIEITPRLYKQLAALAAAPKAGAPLPHSWYVLEEAGLIEHLDYRHVDRVRLTPLGRSAYLSPLRFKWRQSVRW